MAELRYHPWGATRYSRGATPTDRQFTGQVNDIEIGLYFYQARYYDPYLNRFISPDTIIPEYNNPQSLNRYSYVYNNPLKYYDPDGHIALAVGLILLAAGGAGIVDWGIQVKNNMDQGMSFLNATSNASLKQSAETALTVGSVTAVVVTAAPVVVATAGQGLMAAGMATGSTALWSAGTATVAAGGTLATTLATNSAAESTSEGTPFGEYPYQFSGRRGGFKSNLNSGEFEMSLSKASDFSSPAEAFEATFGRPPSSNEMYRVTTVGTAWHHHFYPVYNSLEDGNPLGHVSLYPAGDWDSTAFEQIFNPILFGLPQPLIPQ